MAVPERDGAWPLVAVVGGNVLFASGLIFHAFLYNFYLEALHLTPDVMGRAAAALTGGGLLVLLPAGALTDRIGPRHALTAAAAVLTLGLTLGALATGPAAIYGAAGVAGAGSGIWRVATGPILMGLTTPHTRARAFAWNVGLLVAWGGAANAIAGAASTWLESGYGLSRLSGVRIALLLGASGSALSVLVFRAVRAAPAATAGPVGDAPPSAVRDRGTGDAEPRAPREVLALVALVAVWMTGAAIAAPFFNIYFSRAFARSIEWIGAMFAVTHVGWALAVIASGELARRFGARRALLAALLCFAPAMWGLSLATVVPLAIGLYFAQGLIGPITNPLIDQWLLGQTPRERHGVVSSWRQAAADASAMAGASYGGHLLAGGSFGTLFAAAGGVGLLGAIGLIVGARRASRAVPPAAPAATV